MEWFRALGVGRAIVFHDTPEAIQQRWREEVFVVPVNVQSQRTRIYTLSEYWMALLKNVLVNTSISTS